MFNIMKENIEDLQTPNLWLALPAELLGTLAVTLLGCASWQVGADSVHVALTFGLTVATVVWIFSHISGGHVNPAVTMAALFTRRVSIIRGVLYIVAQVVGGIAGAGILYGLSPQHFRKDLGVNVLAERIQPAQGFGVEFLATFLYVLTVFASLDDKRTDLKGSAPLTIGLAVVVCHLFALPYTRASLNPARSFGPALVVDTWKDHWVFWLGPIAGALLGGLLYEYIFAAGASFQGVKKCLLRTKRATRKQQYEPEKLPFEEGKNDVIEITESKSDVEKQQDAAEPEAEKEKEKAEVEEINEQEKK